MMWLWRKLMKYAESKNSKVFIMDREEKEIYMIRYIVFKSKYVSFYIHRFLRSDHDVHHDHPWNFFTYIITKGYTEELLAQGGTHGLPQATTGRRKPGSLAFRRAEDTHRVILDKEYTIFEQEEAPLTACLILKRRRIWGFKRRVSMPVSRYGVRVDSMKIDGVTQGEVLPSERKVVGYEWVNWKDYLGITPDDPKYFGSE